MEQDQQPIFGSNILLKLRKRKSFFLGIILSIIIFSIILLTLFSVVFFSMNISDFELSSFHIIKVEEDKIYADLSLNFSKPLPQTLFIRKIDCKLYQENFSDENFLAYGTTQRSFAILRNNNILENVSFLFQSSALDKLIHAFFNNEKVGMKGKIYFRNKLSYSFIYSPKQIDVDVFPKMKILHIHPVPPGSTLEIFVEVSNIHNISLNIDIGNFQLYTKNFGILGNVSFTNVTLKPGYTNISLLLYSNEQNLIWIFEEVLNNGTLEVEIHSFNVTLKILEYEINILIETSSPFLWEEFSPSIQIMGIANVKILETSFDVNLGILGELLWGYNITPNLETQWSIKFEFHFPISETDTILIGNGSTNVTTSIEISKISILTIHINVFSSAVLAAGEMLALWLDNQKINIDIRNGVICLQFYEITILIHFQSTISNYTIR